MQGIESRLGEASIGSVVKTTKPPFGVWGSAKISCPLLGKQFRSLEWKGSTRRIAIAQLTKAMQARVRIGIWIRISL
jgi:hypothetical protein